MNRQAFKELLATLPGGKSSEHENAVALAESHGWSYEEAWQWAFNSGWYVFRRPGVAEDCFGMLRAVGAPPEYALVFRSTITAVDAAVCFKSGLPASYAVAYRGWGINTRIRFFEAGVPVGYAPFSQQLTVADVLTLTEAGCPVQYAAHVIRFHGDGPRILELWRAGVPLEYVAAMLDGDEKNG